MRTREVDERERSDLSTLESQLAMGASQLHSVLVRTVIVKPENPPEWRAHLATVDFVAPKNRGELGPEEYEDLRLVQNIMSVTEGLELVRSLVTRGELDLREHGTYLINGRFRAESYRRRDVFPSSGYFNLSGWPARVYRYEADEQAYNHPYGPFLRRETPVFNDFGDAASHWLGGSPNDQRLTSGRATVWVRIGEYRGRIEGVRIGPGAGHLKVSSWTGKMDDLVAHVLVDGPEGRGRQLIEFPSGEANFTLPIPCSRISMYLLDKSDESLLDYRHIDFAYAGPERDPSVRIEQGPDDIDAWLSSGENEWIEFKTSISDDDLLETVVSFANGEGGRILIGVDDNAKLVGFGDPKGPQRIEALVHGRVDPVPDVAVRSLDHHGKPILVVEVPTGENPPYLLRERGVFIRSGSTDRVPTRAELELLMRDRRSEFSRAGLLGFR